MKWNCECRIVAVGLYTTLDNTPSGEGYLDVAPWAGRTLEGGYPWRWEGGPKFCFFLAFYSFLKSDLGQTSWNNKLNLIHKIKFLILIFIIGILNGSISSGTGLFVTILLIKSYGMDFLRAISLTFFTVWIFWNFTGAIFLSKVGSVPLNILLLLIVGSFTGGYCGAHLSQLKGNKLIKKTFTIVSLFVGISLFTKSIMSFM